MAVVSVGILRERGPLALVGSAWRYRQLILRLVIRDFEARFRGSLLGKLWVALVPLLLLGLYTYVFGVVMQAHWPGADGSTLKVALLYYVGLVLFDFFFECINRAPSLLLENVSYIKKVVFPLDILAWVVIGNALVRLAFGGMILVVFYLAIEGVPPIAALVLPLLVLLLALVALGLVWFLSALGIYVRDIRQALIVIAPATMFLSPIFFPLSTVPQPVATLLYLNPLTFVIETARAALFSGAWPDLQAVLAYMLFACLFAWLGRVWFMSLRGGFADVV